MDQFHHEKCQNARIIFIFSKELFMATLYNRGPEHRRPTGVAPQSCRHTICMDKGWVGFKLVV